MSLPPPSSFAIFSGHDSLSPDVVELNTFLFCSSNMSFVEKFKSVSTIEYMKCTELTIGRKYPIIQLQNVETKYGSSVLATIQDPDCTNRQFRVYLPKRYSCVFSDEELRHIHKGELHLVYGGKQASTVVLDITSE